MSTGKTKVKVGLRNVAGTDINPATSDKQNEIVSAVDGLEALITTLNGLITSINAKTISEDDIHILLQQIRDAIRRPLDYVEATNSRQISGTATVSIAANQDIRTVTTVTGLTNIGGYSADQLLEDNSRQAWGATIRALIT